MENLGSDLICLGFAGDLQATASFLRNTLFLSISGMLFSNNALIKLKYTDKVSLGNNS